MIKIDKDYSQYMHTYEAFRIPKGHEALKAPNSNLIKADDGGSMLILTPDAAKQLIKDRFAYGDVLFADAQKAAQKSQAEGYKQYAENQSKALSVFRSMSKGDNVPSTDEEKLMSFDPKLYQAAKMAQMLAQQAEKEKAKDKDSEWDEREEAEKRAKLDKLNEESNAIAESMGVESHKFAIAQESMVVEVDVGSVNLSSIRGFFQFTDNIGGAFFDQSV